MIAPQEFELAHNDADKDVDIFFKGTSPKMNLIARLEFELTNCDVVAQFINHFATKTTPSRYIYMRQVNILFFAVDRHKQTQFHPHYHCASCHTLIVSSEEE